MSTIVGFASIKDHRYWLSPVDSMHVGIHVGITVKLNRIVIDSVAWQMLESPLHWHILIRKTGHQRKTNSKVSGVSFFWNFKVGLGTGWVTIFFLKLSGSCWSEDQTSSSSACFIPGTIFIIEARVVYKAMWHKGVQKQQPNEAYCWQLWILRNDFERVLLW